MYLFVDGIEIEIGKGRAPTIIVDSASDVQPERYDEVMMGG